MTGDENTRRVSSESPTGATINAYERMVKAEAERDHAIAKLRQIREYVLAVKLPPHVAASLLTMIEVEVLR